MNPFTPAINSKGLFRVGAPFDALLVQDLEYECKALRSFTDVTGDGIDVFATYYEPQGLSLDVFNEDVTTGASLVTLQPGVGVSIVIPSTYFVGVPDVTGVPYLGFLVALDLAVLPSAIDLSYLQSQLAGVVKDTIGVITVPRTVVTTHPLRFRSDQHAVIEATRNQNKATNPSDYARFLSEQARANSLQERVTALEQYIVTNRIVPAPSV